jgi:hypothetical protein
MIPEVRVCSTPSVAIGCYRTIGQITRTPGPDRRPDRYGYGRRIASDPRVVTKAVTFSEDLSDGSPPGGPRGHADG